MLTHSCDILSPYNNFYDKSVNKQMPIFVFYNSIYFGVISGQMHNKSLITPEKYVTQLFLFHNVYHLGVNSVRLCVWYRAVGVFSVYHIFFFN